MRSTGPARRGTNLFIGGCLALQVAVPASYYLGDDPSDERFAWRMFSPERVRVCAVRVTETSVGATSVIDREVDLRALLQRGWRELLVRDRPAVVDAFLSSRCEAASPETIRFERFCRSPDGAPEPSERRLHACP